MISTTTYYDITVLYGHLGCVLSRTVGHVRRKPAAGVRVVRAGRRDSRRSVVGKGAAHKNSKTLATAKNSRLHARFPSVSSKMHVL